ncbi:hypothetical protein [Haliovirga abyssi]|uniref:hypothetical protein n=1 Tax=Haliovirga abyssi TaxID=2996794 RepID=UPI0027DAD96D|nr:hypothetical protein [Haliovirga abyssi]
MFILFFIILGIFLFVRYNLGVGQILIGFVVIMVVFSLFLRPVFSPFFGGYYSPWGGYSRGSSFFFFNNSHSSRSYTPRRTRSVRRSVSGFRNRGTGFGK